MVSGHYGSSRHYRTNAKFVRQRLEGDGSGHDWWHIERVRNMAVTLGREENADLFIVELGALLHDIADWKFHDDLEGLRAAREWLESLNAEPSARWIMCMRSCATFRSRAPESKPTCGRSKAGSSKTPTGSTRWARSASRGLSPTAVTKPRHARSKSKTRAS